METIDNKFEFILSIISRKKEKCRKVGLKTEQFKHGLKKKVFHAHFAWRFLKIKTIDIIDSVAIRHNYVSYWEDWSNQILTVVKTGTFWGAWLSVPPLITTYSASVEREMSDTQPPSFDDTKE